MDDLNQRDLLIRLDANQTILIEKLNRIESKVEDLPAVKEKIKTLEKLTWGAVLTALVAIFKSMWDVFIRHIN